MRRTKTEAKETRNRILDAAESVFFEKGVSGTSLADIAAEAGVTRGAIYWHFADKLDLFRAMQDRVRLPQEEFLQAQDLLRSDNPLDALREATLEMLRRFVCDARAQRVYTILLLRCEYVGEMHEVILGRREGDERMKRTVVAAFERARALGHLLEPWPPVLAANAYSCATVGLFSEWLRSEGAFDIVATGATLMDGMFGSFGAKAAGIAASARPFAANDLPASGAAASAHRSGSA